MPAVSKKQQRFFGMVRAAQKGEMKNPSSEVSDVASEISMKDAKKFAKTKHKGLPEKKKVEEAIKRDEYGDPIGGPKISKKERAKNLARNEKDEKIVHSESKGHKYDNSFIEGETGSKRARRDTTAAMNRSGMGYAKVGRQQKERQERHKADRGKKTKGTKAGHSGSAYPQRSHTMDTMYPHKKEARLKAKAAARKKLKEMMEGAAWTKKAGKNSEGGLNEKGRKSYEAQNPGSDLKAPVTTKPSKLKKGSKSANRRKSFCKRMEGMKKKLTSAKTARDPDSRINKSLRKWNCGYEPQGKLVENYEDRAKSRQKFVDFYKKAKEAKAKKQADATRSDSRKHGIKFSDAKGSGRIKAGKKVYD